MSVALVSAIWRSQSAATVEMILRLAGTALVKPSSRAALVTSPEVPPISATVPPRGSSLPISAAAWAPASALSVPM